MTAGLLRAAGEASLSAAVMILAVLALRTRFQDRTPRRAFCLLWDLVLVRLMVLAELPSPVSIRKWLPVVNARVQSAAVSSPEMVAAVTGTGVHEEWQVQTAYLVDDSIRLVSAGTAAASPAVEWDMVLTALWLAAALLLAGGFLWSHLRSRRIYAASLPSRDAFILDWLAAHPLRRPVQARTSDQVAAPLTYGVLYPVILLPRGIEDRETLACVLAHEHAHIRRFDALRKLFLAAALCLHWFNPLVWAMYVLANRDIELACDEAVLRGGADREQYALALLSMEERRGQWSPSGSHFSGPALEKRILAIMKRKRISAAALAAVIAVMGVTTTVFACAAPEGGAALRQDQSGPAPVFAGVLEEYSVTMAADGRTGAVLYSLDCGETWMDEEHYHAQYGEWGDGWEVQWWTYKDYKAWLEQEKQELQAMIGEQAYIGSEGWITWDQERVDAEITLYEQTLEEIGRGALYSRAIWDKDGKVVTGVSLSSDGTLDAVVQSTNQPSSVQVNIFLPSWSDVLAAREQALSGMTQEEVTALNKAVIAENYKWEYGYLYNNIFGRLEDPDSPAWEDFDQDAERFTSLIDGLRETVRNEALRADLQYLIDEAQLAAETHGMEHANNLYKMLHDLDYYLLRYGPAIDEGTDTWIQDKSTVSKYYGMLSVYF